MKFETFDSFSHILVIFGNTLTLNVLKDGNDVTKIWMEYKDVKRRQKRQ